MKEVPTAKPNLVHHVLAQRLEILSDLSVGGNYRSNEFERVKKKEDLSLEEVLAHKTEIEKPEKTLVDKLVAMKTMTLSALELESTVIRLETKSSLLM